jgi:hypothetical protein
MSPTSLNDTLGKNVLSYVKMCSYINILLINSNYPKIGYIYRIYEMSMIYYAKIFVGLLIKIAILSWGFGISMNGINPVRANNAIDEVAFAIHFKQRLDSEEFLVKLENLAHEIKDVLPEHEMINSFTVELSPLKGSNQTSEKPSGITCYKTSKNIPNRHEWSLRIDGERITVGCSEYSSWNDVSTQAKGLLSKALKKIDITSNPINEIAFQCIDRFESDTSEPTLADVFNISSIYLTKHLVESNESSWHVHQGWFTDSQEIGTKLLNNLNINSHNKQYLENGVVVPGKAINETIISHLVRIKNEGIIETSDINDLNGKDGYLTKVFNAAHNLNKEAIKNLLNESMLLKIGLDDV